MGDDVVLPAVHVEALRGYLSQWNARDEIDPASGVGRYDSLIEMAGYLGAALDRAQGEHS